MEQAPFREAEVRPKCAFCHELTDGTTACPRCGRPLCAQHQVGGRVFVATEHGEVDPGERRCASCEEEFWRSMARAQRQATRAFWAGGVLFITGCVVAGVLNTLGGGYAAGWASLPYGSPLALALIFGAYSLRLHRVVRRTRRRFLKERTPAPRR